MFFKAIRSHICLNVSPDPNTPAVRSFLTMLVNNDNPLQTSYHFTLACDIHFFLSLDDLQYHALVPDQGWQAARRRWRKSRPIGESLPHTFEYKVLALRKYLS